MGTLPEILNSPENKTSVIADCLDLIDQEVADKRGVSGLAIKAGYKAVRGIRPSFLRDAVESLVPQFAEALDPLYQEAQEKGQSVGPYLEANGSRVAGALLGITDRKADSSEKGLVKTTYGKLRPSAEKNVVAAVPRLSRLVEKYATS